MSYSNFPPSFDYYSFLKKCFPELLKLKLYSHLPHELCCHDGDKGFDIVLVFGCLLSYAS